MASPPTESTTASSILVNRYLNKGSAFTLPEREKYGLLGRLPPRVETINQQVARCLMQFDQFEHNINKYQLLSNIHCANTTLFYALISKYPERMLPIIYTPTVGEACEKFGSLYQRERGLYMASCFKGRFHEALESSGYKQVDMIVITDGSRILGLGDLGANGMGISLGKCSLYVVGAGLMPRRVLPVMIDVGTNNEKLRNDPTYLGQPIPRIGDPEFYACMDEFMESASKLWPKAVIQFEDFSNNHCFDMLERYQNKYRCFNDDIQGTGTVISAGFANAIRLSGVPVQDHRILVFGAGSAAVGVVQSIADLCATKFQVSREEVLEKVYLVDSKGLVSTNRGDKLQKHKVALARNDVSETDAKEIKTLDAAVKYVKPTALIGLGGAGPVFTEEIIKSMLSYCKRPIVFPLSNPTSKAEVNPADAYKWTNGEAIIASGSPFPEVIIEGKICRPSQGNNMYVFPGMGLGAVLACPTKITNESMVAAADRLSSMLTVEQMEQQSILYPPIDEIRNVSRHIAVAVIQQMQKEGTAQANLPDNKPDLIKLVDRAMYIPQYPPSDMYIKAGKKQE